MKNTKTAYILWCLGFFGLCGVHRFYAGKIVSGMVWLLTFGFCFIAQIIDLALIPSMISEANREKGYFQPSEVITSSPPAPVVNQVINEREIIEKERIKVRCSYCRALVDEGQTNCPNCGAPL